MHASSHDKMRSIVDQYLGNRRGEPLVIHDLGSQDVNGSYRALFDSPNWRYTGLDMVPGANVDLVLKTPYDWREVASGSVDVLISGQAFEHIRYVWITMLEVARVLKPGGLCVVIAPSGGPEHRYPVDCWRFYPDGMESLARFAQLDLLRASTQWQAEGYADGSDAWHDSVLICRKPDHGAWWNLKSALKRWLQHRSMTQGLVDAPPTPAAPPERLPVAPAVPAQATQPIPHEQLKQPGLAQCRFYHSVDLPGGESVKGEWDLRPTVGAYLGGVDFAGRTVLEIGPASGYLTFHMEAAGASVTALEPPMEHLWDVAPMPDFDLAAWREDFVHVITGVRHSFQYLHHLHDSQARLIVAHLDDLPESVGSFDIGLLAAVLLHCRSPFSVMEHLARRVTDTLIVTEAYDASLGDLPVCRLLADTAHPQVHTWWALTPAFVIQSLGLLGFPKARLSVHHQKRDLDGAMIPMFTVVARRA
ncbi:methyltransferase domain-containing protein [Hydrogenophaga taeniospiralis]|uniref:methyltransferase domain-containing protein n=1 Tax=Hydrogenophaga taeniospiralis TaxID=65656 RepID=UPI001CFB4608|nr:methyltransferase domain-containing protein [Hydrogenophaga taeniospiralis]MCB4362440.1 methyltransferase domain-containing protein [Hydrogenophaga taeniospiralis]